MASSRFLFQTSSNQRCASAAFSCDTECLQVNAMSPGAGKPRKAIRIRAPCRLAESVILSSARTVEPVLRIDLSAKLVFTPDVERLNHCRVAISFDFLSPNHPALAPACIRERPELAAGLVEELVTGPALGWLPGGLRFSVRADRDYPVLAFSSQGRSGGNRVLNSHPAHIALRDPEARGRPTVQKQVEHKGSVKEKACHDRQADHEYGKRSGTHLRQLAPLSGRPLGMEMLNRLHAH